MTDFEDVKEPYQDDDLLAASSLDDVMTPGGTVKNFLERDNFEEELGDVNLSQDFSHIARYNIVDVIGDDKAGRRIVVVYAHRLPDNKAFNHAEFLQYLRATLDRFVDLDYTIVYFHYGLTSRNKPPVSWLIQAYKLLDRKYKKNLKDLYLVHPTKFIKIVWNIFRPFISVKFERKLHYLNYIDELRQVLHEEQIAIPPEIEDYDAKLRTASSSTASSFLATRESINQIPLDTQQFGVPLDFIQAKNVLGSDIPRILVECATFLRSGENLLTEGLFRRSVGLAELKSCQARINRGESLNFEQEPNGVHLAAVLIKSFLRELPEPVTTFELYPQVSKLQEIPDDNQRKDHVKTLIHQIPPLNRAVLEYVIQFLTDVMAKSEVNKMNASNLSIVFGPNLAWPQGSQTSLSSMQNLNNFAYILITQFEFIFSS